MYAKRQYHDRVLRIGIVLATGLLLAGCGDRKPFTIGVLNYVSVLNPVIEGFKAEMTELGYVEGDNVIYIDNGVVDPDPQAVDAEIERLLAQDIDLLFPVGTLTTLRAKHAVEGTDMPVVFGVISRPVDLGLVKSISQPGGNVTGTQISNHIPKALEWLVTIAPETRKVYVPYNPDDHASIVFLDVLSTASSQIGVELIFDEIHSVEETIVAMKSLPDDIDAVFRIPSATLDPRSAELSQAAIEQGLPLGMSLPLDETALLTLAADLFGAGKQAAGLVHEIRQGSKPADLMVKTTGFFLAINLKTAEAIGLDIPDEVLLQADTIIR
jgi:putative ABC transport system substrate-binding protein